MDVLDFDLGIVDYRNVIKTIKEVRNYDYSEYALTSLKHRIETFSSRYGIRQAEILNKKLTEDDKFFEQFVKEIAVESSEMFRDPSFWRFLRDDLLATMVTNNYRPRIWFPSCISGDELFSLLILLKEKNWLDKFDVYASYHSDLFLDQIKKGYLKGSKIEVSSDNYERFQGVKTLKDYYSPKGDYAVRDTSLLKNVSFIKQNINFDYSPQDVKLVICRNQLIYFSQTLHDKVLKTFYDNIIIGGYLVLGIKEQVGMMSSKYFRLINESESIYKKI